MNFLDIIFIIPIIWFAYQGFKRGFIIELTSLVALVLGIYAAMYFSGYAADFLKNSLDMGPRYIPIVSFIITFIGVVIIVYFIGKLLEKVVNIVALGFVNKLVGGIFGILKAVIFISVVLLIINHFNDNLISKEKKKNSILYEPIEGIAPLLWQSLEEMEINESPIETIKEEVEKVTI